MIPTHFMARLLGVPNDDCDQFVEWAQQMSAVYDLFISDPENADQLRTDAAAATKAMSEYSGAALAQRVRDGDKGDLLSAIALTDVEISEQDKRASITLLIFGGQDTTESWAKNAVTCLGEHPDQRRAIQEDRSLLRQSLDEVIRWRPPVCNEVRVVRNDGVEIDGVPLAKGDSVSLVIAAAHREPSRWENADAFDIFRPEMGNLGFGFGLHNCIGVNSARLVVTTVVNKLLDEVPAYRLVLPADELDYGQSFAIRGPKAVLLSL
jgi:cytochrome P450